MIHFHANMFQLAEYELGTAITANKLTCEYMRDNINTVYIIAAQMQWFVFTIKV